jgi:hypothetical protein
VVISGGVEGVVKSQLHGGVVMSGGGVMVAGGVGTSQLHGGVVMSGGAVTTTGSGGVTVTSQLHGGVVMSGGVTTSGRGAGISITGGAISQLQGGVVMSGGAVKSSACAECGEVSPITKARVNPRATTAAIANTPAKSGRSRRFSNCVFRCCMVFTD